MLNRVLVVTGGARGIGSAIVRRMAREKYDVLVTYNRSQTSAQQLIDELAGQTQIVARQVDVSSDTEVDELFAFCEKTFGRLDVLVNCASHSSKSGWDILPRDMDWGEWQKTIDIDLKGSMLCSHAAFEFMKEQGGKIINFSSSAALYGDKPTYFYTAAKSALVGVTRAMARLFAPNVQVNCIAPGSIATDWIAKWKLTENDLQAIANESPSLRIGKPEEVAELVAFLASPQCTYITGQTFIIDGGILMI
jgi:3-oxoacyl-[acyl-carrier protein] reductase